MWADKDEFYGSSKLIEYIYLAGPQRIEICLSFGTDSESLLTVLIPKFSLKRHLCFWAIASSPLKPEKRNTDFGDSQLEASVNIY